MATGPIETHLHRSFNWENGAPGARMGPRGRSASCGNGLSAQRVRLRSEINQRLVKRDTLCLPPTNLTASAKTMAVYYDESLNRDHSETC